MNNESVYWLWLAKTLGAGAKTADIINYFGSARMLYEKGSREWRLSGILTASQINKLSLFSPSQFAETLRVCVDNGWRIVNESLAPENRSATAPAAATQSPLRR